MQTFRLPGARAPSPFPDPRLPQPTASRNATPTAAAFRPPAASDRPRRQSRVERGAVSRRGVAPFSTDRGFRRPAAAAPRRTRRSPPAAGMPSFRRSAASDTPRLPTALGGSPANAVPSPHRRAAIIVGIPAAGGKRDGPIRCIMAGLPRFAACRRAGGGILAPSGGGFAEVGPDTVGSVLFSSDPGGRQRSAPGYGGARPVFFRPRRAANVICTRFYGDHAAGGGVEPHRGRARVRDAGRALPRPTLS